MQRVLAEFAVSDAGELECQLERAVDIAIEEALESQHYGVLVTRHDNHNFTVAVTPEVPFGMIHELDQRRARSY